MHHATDDLLGRAELLRELAAATDGMQTLYNAVHCGIIVVERSGEISHANQRAGELLGVSLADLVGRTPDTSLWRTVGEDGVEISREQHPIAVAFQTGQPARYVTIGVYCPDGECRWLQVDTMPVPDSGGQTAQVVTTLTDVTEHRRKEEELEADRDRSRTEFHCAAIGMERHDLEGRIRETNRALEEMLGYGRDELKDKHLSEITHPEDVERLLERLRQMMEGNLDHYETERRLLRKDGGQIWGYLTVSLIRSEVGEPLFAISWVTDITERKQAEQALRESEQRFRAIFESSPIGIARLDLDGRIVQSNRVLQRMLGYTEHDLLTMTFQNLADPEDLALDPVQLADVFAGDREAHQLERRFLRRDGSLLDGQFTVSVVRDTHGTPRFAIGMLEDVSDRKRAQAALEHQALHDPLTGLPNRILIQDRLQQAILTARQVPAGVALLFMDFDRFKEINDTFGHAYGDQVLRQAAVRLPATLRETDTYARLGGDEFAVLLPGADIEAARQVALQMRATLDQPFEVEGHHLHVSASMGIALYAEHGVDAETLMRRAEVAMYVAKRVGSGYAVYTAEADQYSPARLELANELRTAIAGGQLLLHYQPVVQLSSGRTTHVEALVRWQHSRHGLLPPDQFIFLAEEIGLINALAHWVLDAALHQCADWQQAGLALTVAVNLSARNLHDPNLPITVAALLEQYGVAPERLKLELTESVIMAEPERAQSVLMQLNGMGVRLSIDDFGTGYS
ncbi:MAG: sensor domain-containing protein, partial [Dehalococcoidia bacterium]